MVVAAEHSWAAIRAGLVGLPQANSDDLPGRLTEVPKVLLAETARQDVVKPPQTDFRCCTLAQADAVPLAVTRHLNTHPRDVSWLADQVAFRTRGWDARFHFVRYARLASPSVLS